MTLLVELIFCVRNQWFVQFIYIIIHWRRGYEGVKEELNGILIDKEFVATYILNSVGTFKWIFHRNIWGNLLNVLNSISSILFSHSSHIVWMPLDICTIELLLDIQLLFHYGQNSSSSCSNRATKAFSIALLEIFETNSLLRFNFIVSNSTNEIGLSTKKIYYSTYDLFDSTVPFYQKNQVSQHCKHHTAISTRKCFIQSIA